MDSETLLRNLLLFETSIVQSHGLKEVPRMVELFGYKGLMQLLKSGGLQFQPTRALAVNVDKTTPGLLQGQSTASLVLDGSSPTQRPGAFEVAVVRIGDVRTDISTGLQGLHSIEGLSTNRRNRLSDAIEAAIPHLPDTLWDHATSQTHTDLDRTIVDVHRAVSKSLVDRSGEPVDPNLVDLSIHRESETGLFIESNLVRELGLGEQDAHNVIGNALLALARSNVRLGFMEALTAISGMPENELPYFESKLNFILQSMSPQATTEKLLRVVEVAGLPDFASGVESGDLDIDRLLEVRSSRECSEFRVWLQSLDGDSEDDVIRQMVDMKAKLGVVAGSRAGRVVRFGAVSGIAAIPGIGMVAGPILGAIDGFLLGRLLPDSGPAVFLSRLYPSMFESG